MEKSKQKPRWIFTPQQKFKIIKDIKRCTSIQEVLTKHGISNIMFYQWKRLLAMGVNTSFAQVRKIYKQCFNRMILRHHKTGSDPQSWQLSR
jgi:hypothetical protein